MKKYWSAPMALERIFDEDDISKLLRQNAAPPLGVRNAALIIGAVYWGLTPLELSKVQVKDIIAPNGEFYRIWTLPEESSFNGEARELHTEDHVLPYFTRYIKFRRDNNWGTSNLHSHGRLDPESTFFLNDKGTEYACTLRNPKGVERGEPAMYLPRSMNQQLKRMIARTDLEGATPASFRTSFIKGMYDHGAGWVDLMKVSGIKQKRTLERKVRPHERQLETVLKGLFSKVKMPEHLSD